MQSWFDSQCCRTGNSQYRQGKKQNGGDQHADTQEVAPWRVGRWRFAPLNHCRFRARLILPTLAA